MGSIVASAIYGFVGKLFLYFVIIPAGIILLGYIIYIIMGVIKKEIGKNSERYLECDMLFISLVAAAFTAWYDETTPAE